VRKANHQNLCQHSTGLRALAAVHAVEVLTVSIIMTIATSSTYTILFVIIYHKALSTLAAADTAKLSLLRNVTK